MQKINLLSITWLQLWRRVEVQDGMAISAINEFEKMSDFVLPDIKEEIENLIEMQQAFSEKKLKQKKYQNSEEIKEKKIKIYLII